MTLARRDLLAALAALSALGPTLARAASWDGPTSPGAQRIGQAWLAQNPGTTAAALTRRLAPTGWSLERLRLTIAADFRQGRVFRYRGWRLSDTEAALFALTSMKERCRTSEIRLSH